MDEEVFDSLFGDRAGGDAAEPYPFDNVMLNDVANGGAAGGAAAADGGGGGGGKAPPPPPEYVSPPVAAARLDGRPEPVANVWELSTSCSESSDSEGGEDDARQTTLDGLFEGAGAGASAASAAGGRHEPHRRRRRRTPRSRMECFGCSLALAQSSASKGQYIETSKVARMVEIFCEQSPNMEPWGVAMTIHRYYKQAIYEPLKQDTNTRVPMWHTHEIYVHFYHHGHAPQTYLLRQIAQYETLSQALYGSCFTRTTGGSGVRPALDVMAAKIRVDTLLDKYRKNRTDEYNFHNPGMPVVTESAGDHLSRYGMFAIGKSSS